MGELADEAIDRILSWEYQEWGDDPPPPRPGIARPEPIKNAVDMFATVNDGACCANESRNVNGGCDNCKDPCF